MRYVITKSNCSCATRKYTRGTDISRLKIPLQIGFGDTVADWIHKVFRITPCAACQRRRRVLNLLWPYIPRDSLEYRAWNAYLASGLDRLPCVWDSETGEITQLKKS